MTQPQRLNYTTIATGRSKALGGVYAYIAQIDLPAQLGQYPVYLRVSLSTAVPLHRHAFSRPA